MQCRRAVSRHEGNGCQDKLERHIRLSSVRGESDRESLE